MKMKNEQGFIYIDALIGMVIVGVGLVGILSVFIYVISYVNSTSNYNQAVMATRKVAEELKLYSGLTELQAGAGEKNTTSGKFTFSVSEPRAVDNGVYRIDITTVWSEKLNQATVMRQISASNYYIAK